MPDEAAVALTAVDGEGLTAAVALELVVPTALTVSALLAATLICMVLSGAEPGVAAEVTVTVCAPAGTEM
jgi:hypothetical protein